MSQLTKQQLQVENNVSFPNNNTGYITPQALRGFNSDFIDSVVVNGGTASFATTGSNTFTGDQLMYGSYTINLHDNGYSSGMVANQFYTETGSRYWYAEVGASGVGDNDLEIGVSINGLGGVTDPLIYSNTGLGEVPQISFNDSAVSVLNDLIVSGDISGSIVGIGNVTDYSASVDSRLNNAQGVQGADGSQGPAGTNGAQGTTGTSIQGTQGVQGPGSAQGQIGIQGAQGLKGEPGNTGAQGILGAQGTKGDTGAQGATGIQGESGTNGNDGAQGYTGDTGAQGTIGAQGATGTQGAVGSQGSTGTGTQGTQGTTGTQGTAGTTPSTASFAILGANQQFTGANTFIGNTVVSQSAAFGTASFYAPMNVYGGIATDLGVTGSIKADGDIWAYGANRNFYSAGNLSYSGSQYPGFTAIVSKTETPTDIFGGFSVNNSEGSTLLASVVNSYSPENFGTSTPMIIAGGNNSDGSNTAIQFPLENGEMSVYKHSNFKYGIDVTGSLQHSGSLRHSGESYISGNIWVSGSINLFADGANGFAYSGKALFLTNSVQTGITIESPIHFYQVGKGNMYIQNNVSGVGSGSMNIIAANGANLNISSSNFVTNAGGLYQLGTSPQITLAANSNNSGSQYPTNNIIVAPNIYPTDIFGGFSILTELGNQSGITFLGTVASTYSPQYFGTITPMIIANGNNPDGNDTAIAWTSDGSAEHWKKSNFKYGVDVTGSLTIQSGSSFYANGNKQFNVGAFQDTTTQSGSANTAYAFKFNTTDISQGVSISGSTGLQVANAGTYNIQWSGQAVNGAGAEVVTVWLRKNGTNIDGTGGQVTLASNTKLLPAWNYVIDLAANDVVEIMWGSTGGNSTWSYLAPATIYPACASIIATVSQVR